MPSAIFSYKHSLAAIGVITTFLAGMAHAHAQAGTLLFDNITTPTSGGTVNFHFTEEKPRSIIGDKINFVLPNTPVQISQMRIGLAHLASVATQYTGIQLQAKFYNDGSTTGDVFNSPATDVLTFEVFDSLKFNNPTVVNNTLLSQNAYFLDVALPNIQFTDPYNIGVAFRFLGNKGDGLGYQASDDLSLVLRSGAPYFAGTSDFPNPEQGFFRDGGDDNTPRNDFNFDQEDARRLLASNNQPRLNAGVAMRLYGAPILVPENNTGILFAVGAAVFVGATIVRRRTVKA